MKEQINQSFNKYIRILEPVIIYYLLLLFFRHVFSHVFSVTGIPAEVIDPISSCAVFPFVISAFFPHGINKRVMICFGVLTVCVLFICFLTEKQLFVQIMGFGVTGPISEEIVFRGQVYSRCREYMGFPQALVLTSLLFAVGHALIPQIITAFFAGCILACVKEKTDSLLIPIFLHMGWNIAQILYL